MRYVFMRQMHHDLSIYNLLRNWYVAYHGTDEPRVVPSSRGWVQPFRTILEQKERDNRGRTISWNALHLRFIMSEWASAEPPPLSVWTSHCSFGQRDKASLTPTYSFTPHHHTNWTKESGGGGAHWYALHVSIPQPQPSPLETLFHYIYYAFSIRELVNVQLVHVCMCMWADLDVPSYVYIAVTNQL